LLHWYLFHFYTKIPLFFQKVKEEKIGGVIVLCIIHQVAFLLTKLNYFLQLQEKSKKN